MRECKLFEPKKKSKGIQKEKYKKIVVTHVKKLTTNAGHLFFIKCKQSPLIATRTPAHTYAEVLVVNATEKSKCFKCQGQQKA